MTAFQVLAPPDSPADDAVVAKFVRAWESADLDALVALLTDDVFISMPPMPFEYAGRDFVARFWASIFTTGRRFDLVPTRANAQRGPDRCHDPLREHRPSFLRASTVAPRP